MPARFKLMLVAGEPSGDAHSATLVRALREAAPHVEFEFFGATGPLMRAEGVDTTVNSDSLAIMGIMEVARVFPRFIRAFRTLKVAAIERKPDAVVLVDWPEFNLRLASSLHRQEIKVIYYISPQLWAWRPKRVNKIKRDVDLLLAILPFEVDWYQARGVEHIEFVGHPLTGEVKAHVSREEFCLQHGLDSTRPIISFLPGSRHKELVRILPPMLDAIELVAAKRSDVQFVLVVAPSRKPEEATEILSQHRGAATFLSRVKMVHHKTRDAVAASDVTAVASGTATLEAALLGTPMVIVYKESAINWNTLGRLINVEHYGLANLVAGKRIVTELMQNDLDGPRLADELMLLLEPQRNQELREELHRIADRLGDSGASQKAAEAILRELTNHSGVSPVDPL
jgi:lipid-A-disaccharide synthase